MTLLSTLREKVETKISASPGEPIRVRLRRHCQIAGISRQVIGTTPFWKQGGGTTGKLVGIVKIR